MGVKEVRANVIIMINTVNNVVIDDIPYFWCYFVWIRAVFNRMQEECLTFPSCYSPHKTPFQHLQSVPFSCRFTAFMLLQVLATSGGRITGQLYPTSLKILKKSISILMRKLLFLFIFVVFSEETIIWLFYKIRFILSFLYIQKKKLFMHTQQSLIWAYRTPLMIMDNPKTALL